MRFKKILLLASMAMAVVAFAAPASQAEAPQWYHEGNLVGEGAGNGKAVHMTGSVSNTVIGGGGLVTGPCSVTFVGEAWNENGMADGIVTNASTIQTECMTNVSGCTITPTLQNFNWNLTGATVTGELGVEIVGAQLEIHYMGATCPVPVSTIMATGTMTGIVEEDHRCLTFEEHLDDMQIHVTGLPTLTFDILGTVCDTTLTLT